MGIDIQRDILGLKGQCVNQIKLEEERQLVIGCRRDRRRKAIDPVTEQQGTVNRYVRRQVRDVPLFGYPCVIEMELAQVCISKNERRIESCEFVDTGWRFTRRFCRMISGLCRHMSIQAVSRHMGIRWETVKKIDKAYLEESLPALDPTQLTGLKYLGVDEVARAKGHDYMTVIYDMVEGHLIGVETGRTADVFSAFLKQLPAETTENITLYILKEQLQALWESKTVELMQKRLEAWCRIADQSTMLYLKKFAKSLRNHCVGICNYARHKLTSAGIEAGNIGIGMIRKRARGLRDTEYFKLKIRQSSLPDNDSMFYVAA